MTIWWSNLGRKKKKKLTKFMSPFTNKKKAKAYSEYPREKAEIEPIEATSGKSHKSGRASRKKRKHRMK